MLNRVYRLIAPRIIEPAEVALALPDDYVMVRPTHLSICNADMRYYMGKRSPEALAKKLPMALIHEAVGRVIYDAKNLIAPGTRVVLLPNDPVEEDEFIAENYLRSSRFCGSGFDGFMQEACCLPRKRVLELPPMVDVHVAAFTELVSVAYHAITRFGSIAHARREAIGIWGDGNVGFIVALLLRVLYPSANLIVYGHNESKLADFTFVETHLTTDEHLPAVDHAFECCGGTGSISAISQIIELINPEGTVSLMGVSEDFVPVNTRMLLEKGLRVFGSSRSGRADFEAVCSLYEKYPDVPKRLESLVGESFEVSDIKDISTAFEYDLHKPMGKTIMEWNM